MVRIEKGIEPNANDVMKASFCVCLGAVVGLTDGLGGLVAGVDCFGVGLGVIAAEVGVALSCGVAVGDCVFFGFVDGV